MPYQETETNKFKKMLTEVDLDFDFQSFCQYCTDQPPFSPLTITLPLPPPPPPPSPQFSPPPPPPPPPPYNNNPHGHHHHHNNNYIINDVDDHHQMGHDHQVLLESDEFRMYAYKIKRCTRSRSHDWTECPYAHRGEKATRRDPRKMPYIAIACPAFRHGKCAQGDACEYAHGVFEYWLHPSRYRTRTCNAGRFCQRKVCFFAHTPEQLRSSDRKYVYNGRRSNSPPDDHRLHHHHHLVYRAAARVMKSSSEEEEEDIVSGAQVGLGSGGEEEATSCYGGSPHVMMKIDGGSYFQGVSEFLESLRNLRIADPSNVDGSDSDLPHIGWISDLVK